MAQHKKSFVLYADLLHTVSRLPDDKAGELFKLILSYVNDENPDLDSLDLVLSIAFEPIKQQLKRDLNKWDSKREKRAEAGRLGGLAKASNAKQKVANLAVSVNVNDNVSVNGNVNDSKKNIIDRKRDFTKSLQPHLETYGKDLLNEFFEYWTEHGENDRKMRFEKQKSFGIGRRLSTWSKNNFNEKTGTNNKRGFKSDSSQQAANAIMQRIQSKAGNGVG